MKEIGVELAKEGLEVLRGTKAFVLEQAPDYMVQVLRYELAKTLTWAVVFSAFAAAACLLMWRIWRSEKEERHGFVDPGPFILGALILGCLPGFLAFDYALDALKIWLAPKVFLLEYFAGLVK